MLKVNSRDTTKRCEIFSMLTIKTPNRCYSRRSGVLKKDLREKGYTQYKIEDVDLPGQNKLFISKKLCLYYKVLWSKCEKLRSLVKINKVSENSLPLSISHIDDFGKYFPDLDLSPRERSRFI